MTCFVKSCKNTRRFLLPDSDVTFHRFPKDAEKLKQWLKVIGRDENLQWRVTMLICSEHFKPDDLNRGKICTLKDNAFPSLNIPCMETEEARFPVEITPSTSGSRSETVIPEEVVFAVPTGSPVTKGAAKDLKGTKASSSSSSMGSKSSSLGKKLLKRKSTVISSGSDSSLERKRKRYHIEHSYKISPTKLKNKAVELKNKWSRSRQQLYKARNTIKQLKKKITSLNDVVTDLRKQHLLSTHALDHLEDTYNNVPVALMKRMLQSVGSGSLPRSKYPVELRRFAITLNFYSAKAYNYVRKTFCLALPHPSTLRKWCSSVECNPGFSAPCFKALEYKVAEAKKINKSIICSLMLDEMSIKKQIDFDGTRNWGYVDIGFDLEDHAVESASEALVIMVVCHNASWKLPIAYFLIKSLSGSEKANLVQETLCRLHEISIDVTSVTCDGPTAHFTMFRELGCKFIMPNLKTYFEHPADKSKRVYAIFDICHMIKLIRNCLAELQIVVDSDGKQIKWNFIQKLHDFQENEQFVAANKLRKAHIHWKKQKMKVKLAAQTLSNSVAEALLFLATDLKIPEFLDCEATVKFITMVDTLFDMMNSRLPWATGFKQPLQLPNEDFIKTYMNAGIEYLANLKDVKGISLLQTPRKTPFLGFIISLESMKGIFDDYIRTSKLDYILTYKCSQDHLELFFCSIRSRNGWNNNPSSLQFMRSYKRLILNADVSGYGGNCQVLDTTTILTVQSGTKKNPTYQTIDIADLRRNNVSYTELQDHDYDVHPEHINLSEFAENVVTYISGYVVKMMQKSIYCDSCLDLLTQTDDSDTNYLLIRRRNLGGYFIPSYGIIKISLETELFIRKIMYLTNNSLPSSDLIVDIINAVSRNLIYKLEKLFPGHEDHSLGLLKQAIYSYCKVRLHNLAMKYTEKIQGDLVRKKLTKLILFQHQ